MTWEREEVMSEIPLKLLISTFPEKHECTVTRLVQELCLKVGHELTHSMQARVWGKCPASISFPT